MAAVRTITCVTSCSRLRAVRRDLSRCRRPGRPAPPTAPPTRSSSLDSEPAFMTGVVQPVRELLAVLVLHGDRRLHGDADGGRRRRRGGGLIGRCWSRSVASIRILGRVLRGAARRPERGGGVDARHALEPLRARHRRGVFAGLLWRRRAIGDVLARLSREPQRSTRSRGDAGHAGRGAGGDPIALICVDPDRRHGTDGRRWTKPRSARRVRRSRSSTTSRDASPRSRTTPRSRATRRCASVRSDRRLARAPAHGSAGASPSLKVSRKRIARAADAERSRIERDLHDGAQQRLIALRIKLSLAEERMRRTRRPRGPRSTSSARDRPHARGAARARTRHLPVAARRPRPGRRAARRARGAPLPGRS